MIKFIYFDLGNVLLRETPYTGNNIIGEKLSHIAYESMYDDNFKTELTEFCTEYQYDYTYLKEQLRQYFLHKFQLAVSMQEIQNLSCRYKLGIASNFISDITAVLEPIKDYFSIILLSGAIHVEKPHPDFYNTMIEEATYEGICHDEILFIDDKPENLLAASKAGMHTMQYNNTEGTNLCSAIQAWIEHYENRGQEILVDNERANARLNRIAQRPVNILKAKLNNQRIATYNEDPTVGAIPAISTGTPTEPDTPAAMLSRLADLQPRDNESETDDMLFNEQLMVSLSRLEVPVSVDDMYPVYIILTHGTRTINRVIKDVTHQPYSHASIAFDSQLKSIYSFTWQGFTHENILSDKSLGDYDRKYNIYTIFVSEKQLQAMDKFLDIMCNNKAKMHYSIIGLLHKLFDKETHIATEKFCSQFVADVLKAADETFLNKDSSLYTPYDLRTIKNCFFVERGKIKNYKYKRIERKIEIIREKIRNMIHNEGVLSNFLRRTDNGEILLRYKKLNYREEYNKSHKLIKIYRTNKDIKSIANELAKLWSYYLIIEEIYIQEGKVYPAIKSTKAYKDAVIAKAFILNEVKSNIEYIHSIDPTFDFSKYYEESIYNKDAILITKKDIANIIKLLQAII